ncbi:phosphate ABC transporter permease subunit PstC [Halapricum desulfuricans]|uniref:Phosphate transport system permease protein n=1 Tax=Halapricum desulfuricans TaxID=2841257 RepID=A0A897MRE8_9EURY|nr:phosphate ABC transporter permease subunit PstC [Halapricum desulfuricans]QSG04720.1 ABC-type phosphate transport system, permease component [Halapricum desulfuricans]
MTADYQSPNAVVAVLRWIDERGRSLHRSWEGLDWFSRLLAVGQLVLVVASFVGFLLQSVWTPLFVVAFLLAFGLGWAIRQALTAKIVTFLMTVSALVTLGLIAVFLVLESIPAFRTAGLDLVNPFGENAWAASQSQYSLVPMIWGTVLTTIVAVAVAGPLGIAGALFISEIAPGWLRDVVKPAVEILAGIPSIVYGFIGFTIINPYITDRLSVNPGALFAIGVVIGFMALPTVISVAEDALDAVPSAMKDGSLAVGATDWQTMQSVTVPAAFSGVSAAVLLGIGRAMGETMAATVMISHSRRLPEPTGYNVFDSTETLTTFIASSYGHVTPGETFWSALFAAGVVLLVIVTGLGIASQLVEMRMQRKLQGNQ